MDKYRVIFNKLVKGLVVIYGEYLQQIVLYGSVARGVDTDESDIDIAIFVDNDNEVRHDVMIDLIVELELECGRCISIMMINPEEYDRWVTISSFYKNIANEGIVLWKNEINCVELIGRR